MLVSVKKVFSPLQLWLISSSNLQNKVNWFFFCLCSKWAKIRTLQPTLWSKVVLHYSARNQNHSWSVYFTSSFLNLQLKLGIFLGKGHPKRGLSGYWGCLVTLLYHSIVSFSPDREKMYLKGWKSLWAWASWELQLSKQRVSRFCKKLLRCHLHNHWKFSLSRYVFLTSSSFKLANIIFEVDGTI